MNYELRIKNWKLPTRQLHGIAGGKITLATILIVSTFFGLNIYLQNNKEGFKNAKLTYEKKVYKAYETPTFKLTLSQNKTTSIIKTVFAQSSPIVEAQFIYKNDQKTTIDANISEESLGNYSISPSQTNSFKPGMYTLSVTVEGQEGQRNLTQDFTWGVLALNPNKAVYNPNETANIAIGVLDEKGEMVCDAKVKLRIKNEELQIDNILSTENGKIKVNDQCNSKEQSIVPDYETKFELTGIGTYTLELSATTKNGTYRIQDFVKVSTDISFDIERSSATRLYPKNEYPMIINITANKDYSGIVSETVPLDFAIIKSKQDNKTTDYAAKITEENGFRLINWQVNWKKGEKYTLSYAYKAPNRSPDFFLLGNLQLVNSQPARNASASVADGSSVVYSEGRFWQLANDATVTTLTTADTSPWNVPTDWNDANNTIQVVGAGGNGATSVSVPGGGGGGGAYASISNLNLTEGGTASFQIGAGGSGTATWFSASGTVNAGAGANASGRTGGSGGTATAGTTQTAGGSGGTGGNAAGAGGGGGGGAAGPGGVGRAGGGSSATAGQLGGGGGGGNGGGTDGTTSTSLNGANGGNGSGGSGGTGGAGAGGNAAADTGGGGAGGAGTTAAGGAFNGGSGADSADITGATTGTGGGGGGGGGNTRTTSTGNNGGNGGTATANTGGGGGGGGDCTDAGCTEGTGQTGSGGFIVVSYTPAGINVSGNIYNAGTTTASSVCDANAGTFELSLRTNGATYTASCSNTDGSYTFTAVSAGAAGSGIIIWINDLATDGAIAVRYDGTGDSTANTFYNSTVTVTSDDTNGVTNANMDTYDADTGDVDIPYVVTASNLTASSGAELLVKIKSGVANGSTVFAPGGTVTTDATGGDFHIDDNSAASLDTATSSIGRDILIDTGATLTISGSTTVGGGDITATGTLATSGTPTVTIRGTGSISGAGTKTIYNLTVGDATIATTTLSNSLSVSNNASVGTGSTFNINADLTVTGSLTNTTTGIINHTANSPVVTVSGTSIGGGSGNITFYRLQKAGAGTTTFSGSGANTINDTLDATAGTFTLSNDITVAGNASASTGATLNQNANLTINGGSFLTTGTGVINTTAGTPTLTISGTGNLGGGSGAITLYNLTTSGTGTTTFSGSGTNTINNNVSVGAGTTLNINSSVTVTGSLTNTTTGIITYSSGTPTVTIQGSSLGGGSGAITFYSLTKSGAGTTTFSGSGTNTIDNNLTVSAGTLTISNSLTVGSTTANSGGISNSATLNYSGTPTITIKSSSAGAATIGGSGTTTFYNLSFLPAVATGPTFTLGSAASQTITIDNDLTVGNGSDGVTVTANVNNPIIDINGSLSVAASGIFTAPPSNTFTIAKNITNNGTFNHNSGTVTFDSGNSSTFDGSGTPAITFNNITSTTASKTLIFTASKTFRINGLFTVSGSGSNIQSTSATQWLINLQGTSSITNATITNSGCSGSLDVTLDATSTNGGNNGTCWVFPPPTINSGIKGNTRIGGNVRFQ